MNCFRDKKRKVKLYIAKILLISASMFSCPAFSEVLVLNSSGLCYLKIGSYELKDVFVYADRDDMLLILNSATLLDAHICRALLSSGSESDYIMENNVKSVPKGNAYENLTASQAVIVSPSAKQFSNLYNYFSNGGGGGSSAPPPPTEKDSSSPSKPTNDSDGCEPGSEVCINSKGEASFEISCEAIGYKITTTGDVSISVNGEDGGISINAI